MGPFSASITYSRPPAIDLPHVFLRPYPQRRFFFRTWNELPHGLKIRRSYFMRTHLIRTQLFDGGHHALPHGQQPQATHLWRGCAFERVVGLECHLEIWEVQKCT